MRAISHFNLSLTFFYYPAKNCDSSTPFVAGVWRWRLQGSNSPSLNYSIDVVTKCLPNTQYPPDVLSIYFHITMKHYRVRNFRGRVSNFNQSEARKQCFLASDWLKFETLPRKFRTLYRLDKNYNRGRESGV